MEWFPQDTDKFVEELVTPVLNCLSDPEVRVRYFASESLYNIVKVARSSIIPLFPRIFAALSRLVTGNCPPVLRSQLHLIRSIYIQIPTRTAKMAANYSIDYSKILSPNRRRRSIWMRSFHCCANGYTRKTRLHVNSLYRGFLC